MPDKFYTDNIYPFQDELLRAVESLNLDFYLTGGTALSRVHLNHRYSDDLDFFVNKHEEFKRQCTIVIDNFRALHWKTEVATTSESFVRIFTGRDDMVMKMDFVNDVLFHFGEFESSPIFHRIDNWRNILSNKICALSRMEIKDLADIVFIARKYEFAWEDIINESKEKDLWTDPLSVCQAIKRYKIQDFDAIKWIKEVELDELRSQIDMLHDDIFYGRNNSIKETKR
jgi:predicted nucleotidyltransferase component of viral defense system